MGTMEVTAGLIKATRMPWMASRITAREEAGSFLAFERSVLQMGVLLLVVAALRRLMPARTYQPK